MAGRLITTILGDIEIFWLKKGSESSNLSRKKIDITRTICTYTNMHVHTFWSGVVVSNKVLSMGQIKLNCSTELFEIELS